jgi:hypothetical protein
MRGRAITGCMCDSTKNSAEMARLAWSFGETRAAERCDRTLRLGFHWSEP